MAYARPLNQTFNQLNLHMYRLPDGQRGALRTTSLALAREASREESKCADDHSGSHYNPFKGLKRLYTGFRRHRKSSRDDDDDDNRLRKYYSSPLRYASGGHPVLDSPPEEVPSSSGAKVHFTEDHSDGEVDDVESRHASDSELGNDSTTGSDSNSRPASAGRRSTPKRHRYSRFYSTSSSRSSSKSPTRPTSKHVRFASKDPRVIDTYSPEEYDRRVNDPWDLLTKESRARMRDEMNQYTTQEMQLNDVYNTNDSEYCTLCWREHCHCRALSKDIWRRAKSSSMVRAGA